MLPLILRLWYLSCISVPLHTDLPEEECPSRITKHSRGVSGARQIIGRQPGLAGQYQVAYNPEQDALFVTGSFNHTRPMAPPVRLLHA